MDKPKDDKEAPILGTLRVLARIAGSVVGLLAGTVLFYATLVVGLLNGPWEGCALETAILIIVLVSLVGAVLGAAGGATLTQKLSKQRSSFWRALLGAAVGFLAGVAVLVLSELVLGLVPLTGASVVTVPILIVAGAVIGSGWKAKPAKATSPSS